MTLRKFLSWCYKNANDRRVLVLNKKQALRQRLLNVHMIDTELERGFCVLKDYTRYGDWWVNCLKSPEVFWYLKGDDDDE